MAKGGTLANIGQALAGYGSALSGNPMYLQNSLLLRQAQQQQAEQEAAKQREQMQSDAVRSMMRAPMAGTGTPEAKAYQVNGRTIGQTVSAGPDINAVSGRGLMLQHALGPAFNNAFLGTKVEDVLSQLGYGKTTQQVLKPGETLGTVGRDGKFTATYTAPSEAKEKALPAELQLAMFITGGDEKAAREYLKAKDAPKTDGAWRTLSPQEAQRMNLNPSGSYQVNEKGQIQVITQPKQDAPTETQSKYAYNAKRVADGLGAVNAVLEKDKDAASNWWLNATTDSMASMIPGVAELGRLSSSDNSQIVRNNMADVVDAVITLGTGAAYTQEQLKAARNSFLPQPGESPKVKQDKFRKLASIYEQARTNARTAGQDLPDISSFGSLFGAVDDGGPAMPATKENDPLGIRGR